MKMTFTNDTLESNDITRQSLMYPNKGTCNWPCRNAWHQHMKPPTSGIKTQNYRPLEARQYEGFYIQHKQ